MKIIAAGNGKVGFALTEKLSRDGHELVVIDSDPDTLNDILSSSDVMAVQGNCAAFDTLVEAGVKKAELLIAATNADEINLLCCLTAKRLNPKIHTIARVRAPEYIDQVYKMREDFGLSLIINPEKDAAGEIFKLLQLPGFLKRESFAKGRVEIAEIKVSEDSLFKDQPLSRLTRVLGLKILVCAVVRGDQVFIPNGNVVFRKDDYLYVTAPTEILSRLLKKLGKISKKVRHVTIVGASRTSYYLTQSLLDSGVSVRVIEKNEDKCRTFAEALPKATVICDDASSPKVLDSEGIRETDAFVTLTGMDELNVIMSMYGSLRGVPLVVTKIDRLESMGLLKNLDIGSIVCPKELSSVKVVQYVRAMTNRSGAAVAIHQIANGKVETLEFIVDQDILYAGKPLRDIPLKKNILIACIAHGEKTEIPDGGSAFMAGDAVIIVTGRTAPILSLNDIFK